MTGTPPAPDTTQIESPQQASERADTTDPPLAARWPWWVSAVLAIVSLAVLIYFVYRGWSYVVHHGEAAEKEDYEQLLGLIDRIQTVAMFILGAILGVSVAGAGAASAVAAATKNKAEADKQTHVARHNQHAAEVNQQVAEFHRQVAESSRETARTVVTRASELADSIQELATRRQHDNSRWVSEQDLRSAIRDGDDYVVDPRGDHEFAAGPQLAPADPALELLAAQAARLAADIEHWEA
jgi:gas vesicle protein